MGWSWSRDDVHVCSKLSWLGTALHTRTLLCACGGVFMLVRVRKYVSPLKEDSVRSVTHIQPGELICIMHEHEPSRNNAPERTGVISTDLVRPVYDSERNQAAPHAHTTCMASCCQVLYRYALYKCAWHSKNASCSIMLKLHCLTCNRHGVVNILATQNMSTSIDWCRIDQ